MKRLFQVWIPILLVGFATVAASAQSFRVQCPTSTITHPSAAANNAEPLYGGPTQFNPATPGVPSGTTGDFVTPKGNTVNGAIKCQQISGGDGLSTMADGNQIFMFSFGPLSGLADIAAGRPGTQFPNVFNVPYSVTRGVPAAITAATDSGIVTITSTLNPAIGDTVTISGVTPAAYNIGGPFTVLSSGPTSFTYADTFQNLAAGTGGTAQDTSVSSSAAITGAIETAGTTATVTITSTLSPQVNDQVSISGVTPAGYNGTFTVTAASSTSFSYVGPAGLLAATAFGTAQDASGPTRGDPATTDGATSGAAPWTGYPAAFNPAFTWNGAVGLAPDVASVVSISNLVEGAIPAGATFPGECSAAFTGPVATRVTAWTDAPLGIPVGSQVVISSATAEGGVTPDPGFLGTYQVTCIANGTAVTPDGFNEYAFQYRATANNLVADTGNDLAGTASTPSQLDGHVDPRQIMDTAVMNGNIPAPLAAFDEDDEFFLTLTNVGMIMRPDLFEQHTVHFHGYPNASSFYDGVPDASIAINIGASFTYYYLAPDAGTYFWHCHITPPEHLQMGMVGQLYVRPRQDRVKAGNSLYTYLGYQNGIGLTGNTVADLRTECTPNTDILCSATMPSSTNTVKRAAANSLCSSSSASSATTPEYVYNDGDASTCYDVTYPIQMHGFDPNFHFVGMTFNPEMFVDMKDKYFLLNGRSYPDTVATGPQATITTDGQMHYSQPLPAIINIPVGGKASLRLANLSVAEYFTLQSVGVPMHEVGFNAKLLRDQDGNNTEFYTNSITLGGGEALDVILDASDDGCSAYLGTGCAAKLYPAGSTFYVYSSNLDYLSNDAENFGGMMTEVHICNSVSSDTFGNSCK